VIRSGVVSALSASSVIANPKVTSNPAPQPRIVQVQLDPLSGCGSCSAAGGCGVQLLPVVQDPLLIDCQLPANASACIGERVQVKLAEPDGLWLSIVVRAYGGPTIGMIVGALGGYWIARALQIPQLGDSLSLAGFAIGLGGGLIAWSRAEKSVKMRNIGENRLPMHEIIQER